MARAVIASLALFGFLPVQDDSTVEAWKKYKEAQKTYQELSREAGAKYRQAHREERAEALKEYRASVDEPRKKMNEALETFRAAFTKSDWASWAEMLETGLVEAGRTAVKEHKLDEAAKANQFLVDTLPNSRGAGNALITLGDIFAAQGDVEKAREQYEKAQEAEHRYAPQRLALIGKDAPDIDSETWLGSQARSLASVKGKVVVVDFWATWCGPCRVVMPGLSKMYEKYKDKGLVVMGLTRFYAKGYLPANPEQMTGGGGESVRDMTEETYMQHLKDFKKNAEIAYPFVVGEKSDFEAYQVRGIPTVAVVGRDGKVALLVVGSGSEPFVEAVVERELKKSSTRRGLEHRQREVEACQIVLFIEIILGVIHRELTNPIGDAPFDHVGSALLRQRTCFYPFDNGTRGQTIEEILDCDGGRKGAPRQEDIPIPFDNNFLNICIPTGHRQ